jgi:predicted Fe-Mo cluster-binding NifX family protein
MKIAIPVKTNKENPAVAPLFGKAKWFAFVENGEIRIEKNPADNGSGVVEWLIKSGVKELIIQNMSNPPYQMLKRDEEITIFHAGDKRIELDELLKKYDFDKLTIIDDTNADNIIKNHQREHKNRRF